MTLKIHTSTKHHMKSFLSLSLFLTITLFASAQAPFEGNVTAKLTAISVPEEMKGMEAMFDQTITTSYKGDLTRTETGNALGQTIIITNQKTQEVTLLMDMMGQKIAMVEKMEPGDAMSVAPQLEIEGANIQMTNDTKVIAGHTCKKAIVETADQDMKFSTELWYCTDINNPAGGDKIPGMMMEYEIHAEGIVMHYAVTQIAIKPIDTAIFAIPEGYELKSAAEMQQLIPAMGGED
jgi:GLPGLI family protein